MLIKNDVGPILLIAFTNHALDHMLMSVIKANVTDDIVRLGGRSTVSELMPHSAEELERQHGRTYFDRAIRTGYAETKSIEGQISELLGRVIGTSTPSHALARYLRLTSPDHISVLNAPPKWVEELYEWQVRRVSRDEN